MKREIKFRAWDKKGREMWGISSIAFGRNDEILWLDLDKEKAYPMENVNPDQVELMQYTGLKDKNGKEIYEGDIVKMDSWEPSNMQICFIEGAFCLANKDGDYVGDIHYIHHGGIKQAEIIGNIYENPELLK